MEQPKGLRYGKIRIGSVSWDHCSGLMDQANPDNRRRAWYHPYNEDVMSCLFAGSGSYPKP